MSPWHQPVQPMDSSSANFDIVRQRNYTTARHSPDLDHYRRPPCPATRAIRLSDCTALYFLAHQHPLRVRSPPTRECRRGRLFTCSSLGHKKPLYTSAARIHLSSVQFYTLSNQLWHQGDKFLIQPSSQPLRLYDFILVALWMLQVGRCACRPL